MLFWFPAFFQYFGRSSMEIEHLHITFGILLIITIIVGRLRHRKKKVKARSGPFTVFMRLCVSLLALTGVGLTFAQFVPRSALKVLIYLHGTGAFIFILSLVFIGFTVITGRKNGVTKREPFGEWFSNIPRGSFRRSISFIDNHNKAEGFLKIFGEMLKHSQIKIFLDDYSKRVSCKDIFADNKLSSTSIKEFSKTYASADCLISIYCKYFTISGWLSGWFLLDRGLTDHHIDCMASLFFGYTPCGNCTDFGKEGESHALFDKLGRFIIGEMGFDPILFDDSKSRMAIDTVTSLKVEARTFKQFFEEDIKRVTGKTISVTVDKPNSEIVLIPAVHDYSRQSDTLVGLMVVLDAMQSNWTIGRAFFDGVNYGSFYGDWFIGRIIDNLQAKAEKLGAGKIVVGGCSGVSLINKAGAIITANDYIIHSLTEGRLNLNNDFAGKNIGFANFCARGCYLSEGKSAKEIIMAMALGKEVVELGTSGTGRQKSDQELVDDIRRLRIDILITPYHNSREQFKYLAKKHNLTVTVYGLYELLAKILTRNKG